MIYENSTALPFLPVKIISAKILADLVRSGWDSIQMQG